MQAQDLIRQLNLERHPEGGWYAETWRAPAAQGERPGSTAIHYLLEAGQESHWHRIDATEIWLWHRGDPLELRLTRDGEGGHRSRVLGPGLLNGQRVQAFVRPGEWQAARALENKHGYCLVSCVVAPGFEFDGFELAPEGWEPAR